MANPATANEPSAEDVQAAVDAIERLDADLLAEKMAYMSRCKGIRNQKAGEYDQAADQGISKKLLRTKIKERALERRIDDLTSEFEDDERNEYQMLSEKLGEFGDTPLGAAALARADGKGTQAHAGA
jgi:hypothetical protein